MVLQVELRLDYYGITDETTMAQASTLVPATKMKKAQAWTLALSWRLDRYLIFYLGKNIN